MVNLTRGGVDVDVWIHRNSKISFLELELAVFENFILLWEGEGRGGGWEPELENASKTFFGRHGKVF